MWACVINHTIIIVVVITTTMIIIGPMWHRQTEHVVQVVQCLEYLYALSVSRLHTLCVLFNKIYKELHPCFCPYPYRHMQVM